jgi:hypothetical protein
MIQNITTINSKFYSVHSRLEEISRFSGTDNSKADSFSDSYHATEEVNDTEKIVSFTKTNNHIKSHFNASNNNAGSINNVNHTNNADVNGYKLNDRFGFDNFRFTNYPKRKSNPFSSIISNFNFNAGRKRIFNLAGLVHHDEKVSDSPCQYLKNNLNTLLGSANTLKDLINNNYSDLNSALQ